MVCPIGTDKKSYCQVHDDVQGCRIKFVDYGNEEFHYWEGMRKDLFITEIPVQSLRLKVDQVYPRDVKWNEEEIKLLHGLVVDNKYSVVIEEVEVSP